jgi:hypothetical protein
MVDNTRLPEVKNINPLLAELLMLREQYPRMPLESMAEQLMPKYSEFRFEHSPNVEDRTMQDARKAMATYDAVNDQYLIPGPGGKMIGPEPVYLAQFLHNNPLGWELGLKSLPPIMPTSGFRKGDVLTNWNKPESELDEIAGSGPTPENFKDFMDARAHMFGLMPNPQPRPFVPPLPEVHPALPINNRQRIDPENYPGLEDFLKPGQEEASSEEQG